MNQRTATLIKWLVVLAMPFFLGLGVVTLIVANGERYVRYEYGKPELPAGPAALQRRPAAGDGPTPFTPDEREALALVAVNYLQRPEPAEEVIYLLEGAAAARHGPALLQRARDRPHARRQAPDRRHPPPVGAQRGAGHRRPAAAGLARRAAAPRGDSAPVTGGLATTAVLLFIALFILLFWDTFFVLFHELLFPARHLELQLQRQPHPALPRDVLVRPGRHSSAPAALGSGLLVALAGWLWRRR
jgi:hypothetical protein